MIKVKNEIFNNDVAESLNKMTSSTNFSVPVTFTLTKLKRKYAEAFKDYEETRMKHITELCIKGEKGKPEVSNGKYRFGQEEAQELTKRLNELTSIEIELDIDKLKFKLSKFPEGLLNANDFINLESLFDFEE